MRALVIALALALVASPALAADDAPRIVDLKAGQTFVAPVDGAFVSRDEAARELAAFKREQQRANQCLEKCSESYPLGTVLYVAVGAFVLGAAAVGGYRLVTGR